MVAEDESWNPDEHRPGWRPVATELARRARATLLLAVACNALLELAQIVGMHGYPWQFKTLAYPAMFLLGSLVLWAVAGLVQAVIGRFAVTATLLGVATAVVAFADYEKVLFRREPLYPSDSEFLSDPGFLLRMVGVRGIVLAVVAVAVLATLATYGARRLRNRRAATRPVDDTRAQRLVLPRRVLVTARVLTAVLCLLVLADLARFNSPSNVSRETYDVLGADWRAWSQERNYLGNGFVGGLLYNLDVPSMPPPAGYSARRMHQIVDRYRAAAARINATRHRDGFGGVNLVTVLSESFSDPTALRGVHVAQDPIPFTRRLMARSASGSMLAENVGGGTANMEFEAMTGMSASGFPTQLRVPYQMVVPNYDSFPSVVRWAKSTGHRAVALHPFSTEMYRRREVYQRFGFDRFIYDATMHQRRRIGHNAYISDASAFAEVRRVLGRHRAPVFMNLVTMQNHMPYAGRYDNPVRVTGPDGTPIPDAEQYTRGLTYTDAALQRLVAGLQRLDEPTVLVLYGDHLPGFYPPTVFDANGNRAMHRTPFFVWTSFRGDCSRTHHPLMSPAHFVDLAAECAGARVPPYYALLTELRRQVPADESGRLYDPAGRPIRHGQLSPRATRLLADYRMVQYDLSVGKRYSEAGLFGAAPSARSSQTH